MSSQTDYDIVIIGAGAAGLTAAIFASQEGAKVAIVEANTSAGRKLLKTGGGRCNLTHAHSIEDFLRACQPYDRFLRHCIYEFSPDAVCEYFASHRLETITEPDGCVFPVTNRAMDVLRVLTDQARRGRVQFMFDKAVRSICQQGDGFSLQFDSQVIHSRSVIVATGGASMPVSGSSGDGYKFAKELGHKVSSPRACLVPLVVKEPVAKLAGVSVPNVVLSAKIENKKHRLDGPIIFTSTGIGGPTVLNFGRMILDNIKLQEFVDIKIDFLPDYDYQELEQLVLEKISQSPKRELAGVFVGMLPRSLAIALCDEIHPGKPLIANQLTKPDRQKLLQMLKGFELSVVGTRPIVEATVTRGGVAVDEIDSKTMQSRKVEGLFFAGEVIDVDGPCGGYNLQIAWSTGALAGKEAAKLVKS